MKIPIGPYIGLIVFLMAVGLVADVSWNTVAMIREALRAQFRISAALEKIVEIQDHELKSHAAEKVTAKMRSSNPEMRTWQQVRVLECKRNGESCSQ